MPNRTVVTMLLAAASAACLGAVELKDDPPVIRRPKAGAIAGVITPVAKVARVEAVSRAEKQTHPVTSFDRKTGRFTFTGLPGDAHYDVRVVTTDARTIEGIDLSWIEDRMVRLAAMRRKQLSLPAERQRKFTLPDAQELVKWVADWKDFMELKRVLYVQGHGKRATMLVELLRTREFHAAAGAVVWRVELWYMQNEFGGWDRLANSERVLHRRRIAPAEWRKINLQYYPELSVYIDADGKSKPLIYTLPAKADLSRGRLPNTDPQAKTTTHVRGLDTKPEEAPEGMVIDK
jgi:hypothetical protein